MTITRIQKTKLGRYALFDDDGAFLFSVDEQTLVQEKLCEDMQLCAARLNELKAVSDTRKAKEKALSYLSLRDYAGGELHEKLLRTFDPHSAAAAVAEMRRLDLLNDEKFARHRAKYLMERGKSSREIAQHLQQKGIDRETARAVLDELSPEDGDACYAVVQKSYLRKLQNGERQKVLAALARRGFSYGDAKSAIERSLAELGEEADCGNDSYSDDF